MTSQVLKLFSTLKPLNVKPLNPLPRKNKSILPNCCNSIVNINLPLQPISRVIVLRQSAEEGKSGQQRATHRLRAGPDLGRGESATENYRPDF